MIIVTGGAGFIGSNLVHALNAQGRDDVLVVDDLKRGEKFRNLVDLRVADYLDKDDLLTLLDTGDAKLADVEVVFHQGACSTTTEWDGRYMMRNNYEYSKRVLAWCLARQRPLIYASSAAVYGGNQIFAEDPANERPLNVYGYSKLLFDQYVRRLPPAGSQVAGLRYFNVYGPREDHKGTMASVAYHFHLQNRAAGQVRLFQGADGYGDGEQRRDFVYVRDVVEVNLWLWRHPEVAGIFNVGTGQAQTFNEVARAVLAHRGSGEIEYIPFPETLKGKYQSFTQADLTNLRAAGYEEPFASLEEGIAKAVAAWQQK